MIAAATIDEITRRIVAVCDPERIVLFGSAARGTADDRSDLDLLVVTRWEGRRRAEMVRIDRALGGLGVARDVVVLLPEEYDRDQHIPGTVARAASREGRLLYARR